MFEMPSLEKDGKTIVHAGCKRGNDFLTKGQNCDSIQAYRLNPVGSQHMTLQCVKCDHMWSITIGGYFNIA